MFGITETEEKLNMEVQAPKDEEIKYSKPEMSGIEYQLSRIADELEEMNQLTKISKGILKATMAFLDTATEHLDDMAELDSTQILGLYATGIKEACGDLLKEGE